MQSTAHQQLTTEDELAEAATPTPMRRRAIRIGLLLALLFLILLPFEWIARALVSSRRIPEAELLRHWEATLYQPHPYLGYALKPNYRREQYKDGTLTINSLGFRGPEIAVPKPPGTVRIACLGGSTTFSIRVGDETTYPRLLEQYLRETYPERHIEVINAGVGAYTSAESLIAFCLRVLDLQPDIVLIYDNVNDVHPRVTPGFRSDYSHYRQPLVLPARAFSDFLGEYSTLYAAARYKFSAQRFNIWSMTSRIPLKNIAPSEQQRNFEQTTSATFRRNIRAMIAVAESNHCEAILSTFVYNEKLLSETDYLSHESYRRGISEHNDVMKDISRNEGVLLIDLAARFPCERQTLFADCVHLNSEGSRLQARLIRDAIVEQRLLERIVEGQSSD